MATQQGNQEYYANYDWKSAGEEWSSDWGDTYAFWYGCIMPRLSAYLPFGRALEIGCGYGRLAAHALNYCDHLYLTDIADNCVESCHQRFASFDHVSAHPTDGVRLDFLEADALDLIFSVNSLIHSNSDTLKSLLLETERVLKPGGVAFFHHSNAAIYRCNSELNQTELAEFRDTTTSALLFDQWAANANLKCLRQENINWGIDTLLTDTFSVVVHAESNKKTPSASFNNAGFWQEISYIRALYDHYSINS